MTYNKENITFNLHKYCGMTENIIHSLNLKNISYTINILWCSAASHAVNFCNQLHCEQYISLFYELQVWRVRKRGWLHPNETNCWWMGANISNRKFAQGRCLGKKWSYCVITILWLHLQWCTTWWEWMHEYYATQNVTCDI